MVSCAAAINVESSTELAGMDNVTSIDDSVVISCGTVII